MMALTALIDCENTGSLEGINLSGYERVIIFTGPQQEFVRFPAATLSGEIRIQVIQVPAVAKNNVDFHLVLMLGQLSISMPPEAGFHVISRDKGYDGVINQLRQSGRRCQRVEPEIVPDDNTVVSWVERIVSRARSKPANLPATPKTLDNYLKSATGQRGDEHLIRDIRNELVSRRMVRVYEKTVIWSISMPPRARL
ncbi:PIN domain-containing protein [Klebsiella aerogenes]|uniref:PIN domain-containing protein n=1 Tax=Klebsiella aerogenes TaxID=548 RepID=UPI0032DB6E2A